MEFITTERGGLKLLFEGYAYIKDKSVDMTTYWRCQNKLVCRARIRTCQEKPTGDIRPNHTHPPNDGILLALKVSADIKKSAKESDELTSSIVTNKLADFPLDATGCLPQTLSLNRLVRRQRVAPDGEQLAPSRQLTTRGDHFVNKINDNLTILTTDKNLDFLSSKPYWLCDGTFDSAPLNWQLYSIHALLDENRSVPLVYCIAKNKTESMYHEIFDYLKTREPSLNPNFISIDYEKAAENSIRTHFEDALVAGCYFHFGQCLWRKVQALGLQVWYKDPSNARVVKSFQALGFVSPDEVYTGFQSLVSSLDEQVYEELSAFIGYFESTWVGSIQNGRRRKPMYEPEMWNVLERTIKSLPRTTNSLEGWHRAFAQRVCVTHPTLNRLIGKLRKEQAKTELEMQKFISGESSNRRRTKYQIINDRILSVLNRRDDFASVVEFLRAIAINI